MQIKVRLGKRERHRRQLESGVILGNLRQIRFEHGIVQTVAYVLIFEHERVPGVGSHLISLVFLRGFDLREHDCFIAVVKLHKIAGIVFTGDSLGKLVDLKLVVVVDIRKSAVPLCHSRHKVAAGICVYVLRVICGNYAIVPHAVQHDVIKRYLGSKPRFEYALSVHCPERLRERVISRKLGVELHHVVVCGKLYHAVPALRKLGIVVPEELSVYLKLDAAVRERSAGETLCVVVNEQVQRFRVYAAKLEAFPGVAARLILKVKQIVLGQNDILLTGF